MGITCTGHCINLPLDILMFNRARFFGFASSFLRGQTPQITKVPVREMFPMLHGTSRSLSRWAEINLKWFVAVESAKVQLSANFRDFTFRYIVINFPAYLLKPTDNKYSIRACYAEAPCRKQQRDDISLQPDLQEKCQRRSLPFASTLQISKVWG